MLLFWKDWLYRKTYRERYILCVLAFVCHSGSVTAP